MSEAQLWLVLPLILRVLGDEDSEQLLERCHDLLGGDSALLQRLVAVSARLELIDRLRVERVVQGQEVYADREWREIDQLTAYLAATCIPIGHPSSRTGEAFAGFVASLPVWARDWLAECYVFLEGGSDQTPLARWQRLRPATRTRRIARYWAWVAERYPRQVDFEPWDWHDRAHLPQALHEAAYEFVSLHEAGDLAGPVEMTVGVRKGLAEAEILRFLLVLCLRAEVGLDTSEAFLPAYWRRRAFRTSGLQALREMEANLAHFNRWCGQALHPRPPRADFSLLAGLADQAATQLAGQIPGPALDRTVDQATLRDYLDAVGQINRQIDEFNLRYSDLEAAPDGKAEAEASLFSVIVADPRTRALTAHIEELHRDLSRALDSPA